MDLLGPLSLLALNRPGARGHHPDRESDIAAMNSEACAPN